ncbi:valine--tRNA ligase [Patescibacteria group bacterium]|nr:valine--tRNA ligase [Patescibacteria group bacterium]MBU1931253.1 valine--tRNA ligase [Patescibacteria group bacterium]
MDKRYQPQKFEAKVYQQWEKSGSFSPTTKGKPFCIIMPPPNANDPLHVGHAMFVTAEDILIRYHRMKGRASLWLPGTDHAGIETQFVFEKKLKEKGKSRFDFDRETLYRQIWDYVQKNSGVTVEQMKRLGASADWSRFKFTLDPDIVDLVIKTFVQLYQDGLVYRDLRLVNYCTRCGTAFSDLEVKHVERPVPLYYIKYGPFTLATVRPETKFGDTAIAVHPQDKRYQKWIGQEVEVQGLLGKFKIKVIADDYVDPEFGTGVVKITPAHDPNDFAVWQRHKQEIPGPKQVIGFDGKLNELAGKYAGLFINQARKKVVSDLTKAGLLEKVDQSYQHSIGLCYRCKSPIEPLPMPQFFIKVKPLTQKVLQAIKDKKVKIHGTGYNKVLKHWLTNLKDWNISRQIVWGIRLPVWYKTGSNAKIKINFLDKNNQPVKGTIDRLLKKYSLKEIKHGLQSLQAPVGTDYVVSPTSPGKNYLQSTDTFDTWFSSAQWPILTLKTNQKNDFKRFYPTNVMETAYDILIFWVMRMLMMGLYLTDKVPFQEVYLHGLVRDEQGRKMSKSLGNVINPLGLVEQYGADALRMALVMSTTAGRDSAVGEDKIKGMRNLTNKIWNAARFITLNVEPESQQWQAHKKDKKFAIRLDQISAEITQLLDKLKIGLAAEKTYNYFWHWFCDECIEKAKTDQLSYEALFHGLIVFLKLLHPFVPFVTEAVWQELKPWRKYPNQLLITSKWPE